MLILIACGGLNRRDPLRDNQKELCVFFAMKTLSDAAV